MSNFRGQVKDHATQNVQASYDLKKLNTVDRATAVVALLDGNNYIYPEVSSERARSFTRLAV